MVGFVGYWSPKPRVLTLAGRRQQRRGRIESDRVTVRVYPFTQTTRPVFFNLRLIIDFRALLPTNNPTVPFQGCHTPPCSPNSSLLLFRLFTMSWQAYVDTSLVATGHVDKGAIISAAGDSSWAASADFQLKPEEMKAISAIVSGDDAAKDKAFADGLFIAGSRYVVARADGRSIYARSGRLGVAIAKTKQAIVVGHHGEAQVAGNTSSTVEGLADYLIGQGY
ncbi:hypothetical protein E4U22_003479 [Claviceps purpurea]|nr:hypothetical protein E4U10_002153 [Claviceps purpurea]KAG6284725.1 hypothetical protein E4U46_006733 [Claviceps purpurea]KAG6320311.1 hypothetical protein E4U22_003479 [Claviceps purpurea]